MWMLMVGSSQSSNSPHSPSLYVILKLLLVGRNSNPNPSHSKSAVPGIPRGDRVDDDDDATSVSDCPDVKTERWVENGAASIPRDCEVVGAIVDPNGLMMKEVASTTLDVRSSAMLSLISLLSFLVD